MTKLQSLLIKIPDLQVAQIGGVTSQTSAKNWKAGKTPALAAMLLFEKYFDIPARDLLREESCYDILQKVKK